VAKFKIIWTNFAEQSLYEILDFYLIQNKNNIFSKKLYNEIKNAVQILEDYPLSGKQSLFYNYRELILERNSVFYNVTKDNIEILMVWDNRRNPEELIAIFENL
jgi:plasmid stabilization system protein ParE